ncbi:MAG: DUF2339 domain-containing protein [Betaproteobacteria bacterium]|nr:MAG: DUF2339 domain-containing protein [Betaproteobacteria bacterium]
MVIWGTLWGAFVGLLWPGMGDFGWIPGAIIGSLMGLTLRVSVRNAIKRETDAFKQEQALSADAAAAELAKSQSRDAQLAATAAATREPIPDAFANSLSTSLGKDEAPPLTATEELQTPAPVPMRAQAAAAEISVPTAAPPIQSTPSAAPPAAPPQPDAIERAFNAVIAWLTGGNTVVRAGVVVLFIGLSFLAKYAAENSMFPVELRLALVGAAGLALLITGFRLRDKKRGYAMTLQGAGVAVLYLTVFASFRLYSLLPAGFALAVMVAVCALSAAIALLQNSRALAVIGFAGGFLAPILASRGGGSHVVLFSYYLLLNLAILFIAYKRSWRLLNVVGFVFTFGVFALWVGDRYTTELLANTMPFLVAFLLIYVAAAILYARHEANKFNASVNGAVDATLVFGAPIIAFGIQAALVRNIEFALAFSALALGALYLLLAFVLMKRRAETQRLLIECFIALGVGFVTLAVPLALDARWTAAVWAVEGAAVFWVGMRQARWMPRLFGLALQLIAALSFMGSLHENTLSNFPLANPLFVGALMLALPAFALAWWTRKPLAHSESSAAKQYASLEVLLPNPLFVVGFVWWLVALFFEVTRRVPGVNDLGDFAVASTMHANLMLLGYIGSAFVAERFAKRTSWSVAAWPAYTTAITLAYVAFFNIVDGNRIVHDFGWAFWSAALGLHYALLRRVDSYSPRLWFTVMHVIGVWTLVILVADMLVYAVDRGDLWRTAWASVVLLVAATLTLVALAIWASASSARARWPLAAFNQAYLWFAAAPIAIVVFIGAFLVAVTSSGRADPLTYIPLLNPTDLAIALGLVGIVLWLKRLQSIRVSIPNVVFGNAPRIALAALAFVAINTVWLRVAHHFGGVAWDGSTLFNSFLVQMGYAILWTVLALVLMLLAHRKALRPLWMAGAGLLALTVAKLFFVDLSNAGGTERIIAFIVVGVLMLIVGYVAPLPPTKDEKNGKVSEVKSS